MKYGWIALALLLLVTQVRAANKYVDSGCTFNGNGTAIDCGASGGAAGPWNSMENARTAWACGDTVNIRGVHVAHGSNHAVGTTDGRYSTTDLIKVGNACSAGSPLIIQANGWTAIGAGTQETVYIEGTADPGAWTQCSGTAGACNSPCTTLPGSIACNVVWYVNAAAPMNLTIGAEKPDGSPTVRQTAMANITAQYHSYSDKTTGGNLFVYWGTGADAPGGANNPKPYVFYDNNGFGFFFCDNSFCTAWPQYVTIRGFTIRNTRAAAVVARGENNTIQDMTIKYASGTGAGDDYGIAASTGFANNWTIDSNDISYTGSEAIHFQAQCAASDCTGNGAPCLCCTGSGVGATCGTTVVTITNNYIHDIGDTTILGPAISETPSGLILGNHGTGLTGNSDFTGSKVQGNIIKNTAAGSSCGRGLILENASSNWVIRDNWFEHTYGPAIKIEASSGGTGCDNNAIFNNVFYDTDYGGGCGEGASTIFFSTGGGTGSLDSNVIANNTFVDGNNDAVSENCSTLCTNNTFINNIFTKSGTWHKQMNWSVSTASNVFNHNLTWGANVASNTAVTWKGSNYTCATIGTLETGNLCADPVYVNSGSFDFHIQTTSPAKDAGTATGMPSGRTIDIVNTITSSHSLPSYSDGNAIQNGTWDIGVDEFLPTAAGKVNYFRWISMLPREEELLCRN